MQRPSAKARGAAYQAQAPGFGETAPGFAETAPVYARVETLDDTGSEESANPQVGSVSDTVPNTVPNAGPAAPETFPLGAARGQLHENYIVAQTTDGIVIVDQHAAHERLVYEKLKSQMTTHGVAAQALLIPEIVDLSEEDAAQLLAVADDLRRLGLSLEPFGGGAVAVRETPAILGAVDAKALVRDILDELTDLERSTSLQDRIEAILSRVACHGSIRSGRRMRGEEMNALLREMESTPHSGQCNHGRPTYVELKLSDIERLFGRT